VYWLVVGIFDLACVSTPVIQARCSKLIAVAFVPVDAPIIR
jgi:hypothetical protein